MIAQISWHRLEPDTKNGEQLELITRYTSPNKEIIDKLQQRFEKSYGLGTVIEFDEEGGNDAFC